ncbi:MAG: hypothetical protein ACT4PE_00560 [Candidatus Eiseniibacteriota bacterium]
MAENARTTARDRRLRRLVGAYRSILSRYEEIERLSRTERELLEGNGPVREVNEILGRKKSVLAEIRTEEERVAEDRSWWMRSRSSLQPSSCAELLSCLDSISRAIEGSLALEAECRTLLRGSPRAPQGSTLVARSAYGRESQSSRETR